MLHGTLFQPFTSRRLILVHKERLAAHLRPHSLMHRPHEQLVHLLERDALGLGHEKETPCTHGHEDRSEEEVRPIPQVADHVGRASCDDEGAQPSICCGERHAQHANIEREDLGGVGPGDALPSGADDEGVDVHAHHGEVAPAVAVDGASSGCRGWVGPHHVAANVPHGDAAEGGAPDETLATANALNHHEGKGAHPKGLGDAVEAGGEELEGRA